ncbi:MAG: sulfite exporter TauE/SafE family protein [Symploca sp. SIO2G7]|nr:sulfite exporter TauE/SafE family protein [Symploca sp. SIO2G7]
MIEIVAIFFIAILLRSIFGFGDALIAMPLLSLVLGIKVAAPLFALCALSAAFTLMVTNWHNIDFKPALQLFFSTLFGIPLGVLLIQIMPEKFVLIGLGLFLITLGSSQLLSIKLPKPDETIWVYCFGFVAGILGSAYNVNGAAIVSYATLCQWAPEKTRATLQGYFFPAGLMIVASHALSGLLTLEVLRLYIWVIPAILIATVLGNKIQQRMSTQRFERLLFVLLIILGFRLLV